MWRAPPELLTIITGTRREDGNVGLLPTLSCLPKPSPLYMRRGGPAFGPQPFSSSRK
jgi:hypothetical protein